jgi:hypothetical protein
MSEEFRRFKRRTPDQKIEVVDLMTQESIGTIVNVSEYGIMLLANTDVAVDAIYQCEIRFPPEYRFKNPFVIGIQEMWSEPVASGGIIAAGYRIIDIERTDRMKIVEWINESA